MRRFAFLALATILILVACDRTPESTPADQPSPSLPVFARVVLDAFPQVKCEASQNPREWLNTIIPGDDNRTIFVLCQYHYLPELQLPSTIRRQCRVKIQERYDLVDHFEFEQIAEIDVVVEEDSENRDIIKAIWWRSYASREWTPFPIPHVESDG